MVNQSLFYIVVAVGLLLTFLFVILPGFIGIINRFFASSTPFQQLDTIPPQVPVISAPVPATNSAQLAISGYGEPNAQVILVHNGQKQEPVIIGTEGDFEQMVSLKPDTNTIAFFSVDTAQNESDLTREHQVIFDTVAPVVEIISPEDGASFESRTNQKITISGTVKEDHGAKIYINSRVIFPKSDGTFEYAVQLSEGENKFEIKAEDKAGNTNTTTVTYKFTL